MAGAPCYIKSQPSRQGSHLLLGRVSSTHVAHKIRCSSGQCLCSYRFGSLSSLDWSIWNLKRKPFVACIDVCVKRTVRSAFYDRAEARRRRRRWDHRLTKVSVVFGLVLIIICRLNDGPTIVCTGRRCVLWRLHTVCAENYMHFSDALGCNLRYAQAQIQMPKPIVAVAIKADSGDPIFGPINPFLSSQICNHVSVRA